VTGNVTLVVHDWGSGLGFDWARRHPGAIRGIAYMEAIITTLQSLEEWSESSRELFRGFRSDQGEQLILEDNAFVEKMLPRGILRALDDEEMAEYRRPYREPGESRLATAPGIPKFFVNAEPGVILRDRQRAVCRAWPDQTEITVPGRHFVQKDSGTGPCGTGVVMATPEPHGRRCWASGEVRRRGGPAARGR